VDLIVLKPNPLDRIFLQCFDAVGWVICPVKTHARYDLWCVWWNVKHCSIDQFGGGTDRRFAVDRYL